MKRQSILLLTRLLAQLSILIGIYVLCDQLGRLLSIPIPPGVMGLCLLLLLFAIGWLKPEQLQLAATFLIAEMLLFFIPAIMSLLDYGALLKQQGWRIVITIILSTLIVMFGTVLSVELMHRWSLVRRWRKRHHEH